MIIYRRTVRRGNATEPTFLGGCLALGIATVGFCYIFTRKWFWIILSIFLLCGWVGAIAGDVKSSDTKVGQELEEEIKSTHDSFTITYKTLYSSKAEVTYVDENYHRFYSISSGHKYVVDKYHGAKGFAFIKYGRKLFYGRFIEKDGECAIVMYHGDKVSTLYNCVMNRPSNFK